jgi:hypothetical protein
MEAVKATAKMRLRTREPAPVRARRLARTPETVRVRARPPEAAKVSADGVSGVLATDPLSANFATVGNAPIYNVFATAWRPRPGPGSRMRGDERDNVFQRLDLNRPCLEQTL